MTTPKFQDIITSEEELRALIGYPADKSVLKRHGYLDDHCQNFIAQSPFVLIGTFDTDGACDVSPRGDGPGFVQVLDERTLLIPERPGNRRADTLINILQTAAVGLLFLLPGSEETLRVNGHGYLVRDRMLLERAAAQRKQPLLAIGIDIQECFIHCANALKRSKLWKLRDQACSSDDASLNS